MTMQRASQIAYTKPYQQIYAIFMDSKNAITAVHNSTLNIL